jgi:adenosine deaminase
VHPKVEVKLLLSMNRACDPAAEAEHVAIAIESAARPGGSAVCGVEIGGPAVEGDWVSFEPHCQRARDAGLGVTLHCGEAWARQAEWSAMIAWQPDRLGHCVYLSQSNKEALVASKIPVETAITCHHRHFGVTPAANVFGELYPHNSVALSTDNPSFYGVTLSSEFAQCARAFDLTVRQLVCLSRRAIDFAFVDAASKDRLYDTFDAQWREVTRRYAIEPFDAADPALHSSL